MNADTRHRPLSVIVAPNDPRKAVKAINSMNNEFIELTGGSAYLYANLPADSGPWRFVFADWTVTGPARAVEHMAELLEAARNMDSSRLWWCWA